MSYQPWASMFILCFQFNVMPCVCQTRYQRFARVPVPDYQVLRYVLLCLTNTFQLPISWVRYSSYLFHQLLRRQGRLLRVVFTADIRATVQAICFVVTIICTLLLTWFIGSCVTCATFKGSIRRMTC